MTASQWAACPFCSKVFEVDAEAPKVIIDERKRYLCRACRPKTAMRSSPTRPNGPDNGGPPSPP